MFPNYSGGILQAVSYPTFRARRPAKTNHSRHEKQRFQKIMGQNFDHISTLKDLCNEHSLREERKCNQLRLEIMKFYHELNLNPPDYIQSVNSSGIIHNSGEKVTSVQKELL